MQQIFRLLVIATLILGGSGAALGADKLWSKDDQFVRLEAAPSTAAPNQHPTEMSAAHIAELLGSLRAHYRKQPEDALTVFSSDEVQILSQALAEGLRRASPQQDVVFNTRGSHSMSAGGFLRKQRTNAGRAFVSNGTLNVIFGEMLMDYRKKNVYGQRNANFAEPRESSRDTESLQGWELLTGGGVDMAVTQAGTRSDWVVINAAYRPAPVAHTEAPMAVLTAPEPLVPPSPEAVPQPPVAPSPTPAAPVARRAESPPATAAPATSAPGSIEDRLRRLRNLRDEGLVSQEAYETKVGAILEEL